MTAALKLTDLHKSFGATPIIRGVNLEIQKGELHAIIGPNGAGKSTLFHLISGRYDVTEGAIHLNGREITNRPPFEINRMGLSRSFQVTNIFPRMTVFENVRCALLYGTGHRYSFWSLVNRSRELTERTEFVLDEVSLTSQRNVPAGLLSYADQRALEIGITIAGGAGVIMLDEPTAGMSHTETDRAVDLIRKVAENRTLIMVEHDMGVVFNLAHRISVLVYGEIIASDTPENVRASAAVQEAYLGTEHGGDAVDA